MILFDFRYQEPWAKDTIVFPNFIEHTQTQKRQDQQAEINRQTLDTLLAIMIGGSSPCHAKGSSPPASSQIRMLEHLNPNCRLRCNEICRFECSY